MHINNGFSWRGVVIGFALAGLVAGCGPEGSSEGTVIATPTPTPTPTPSPTPTPTPVPTPTPSSPPLPKDVASLDRQEIATFNAPWAIDFLPDGRFVLTERGDVPSQGSGKLWLVTPTGEKTQVTGVPANNGLLDVRVAPDFSQSHMIYVSFYEPGGSSEPRRGRGASDLTKMPEGLSVFRAILTEPAGAARLNASTVIWRQEKLVPIGLNNQQGGYLAFSPDSRYLFIAAGCRDELNNIQDRDNALAKIIRIFPDGTIPNDNPFVGIPGVRTDIWALGVRNPYGLAFDQTGQLWEHENGPMGGDEINLMASGKNYGWPLASNGRSYGSSVDDIPDHRAGDGFEAPVYTWTASIAPSGLIFYHGSQFPGWEGDALIGVMKTKALIRARVSGKTMNIVQEFLMPARIRTVRQAPNGDLWLVEDAPSGKIVKITPVFAS